MPPAADGSRVLRPSTLDRLALRCQTARHWPLPAGADSTLPPAAAQALADLLPVLICGEASAERAFEHLLLRLESRVDPSLSAALAGVAADEQRHGDWLDALRAALPAPTSDQPGRRALRFLLGLVCDDPALHLARVAALDAAVCRVLAEVGAAGRPIAAAPELAQVFRDIRRDEGRHVRIARRAALALGLDVAVMTRERLAVTAAFAALLSEQAAAFAALGVDPARLEQRIARPA
ncbi:hypothetical protein [Nevskia sp.]|uniref:hypothetical protein n=1 Tax=Nevskia sp. TaxID=1929292 RepID=UPI0025EC936E|nr:hypothetical protein [Nevskia sp.]